MDAVSAPSEFYQHSVEAMLVTGQYGPVQLHRYSVGAVTLSSFTP